jgi:hypothetical protein
MSNQGAHGMTSINISTKSFLFGMAFTIFSFAVLIGFSCGIGMGWGLLMKALF